MPKTAVARPSSPKRRKRSPIDAETIYGRVVDAIMEHRLAPGRKLVEEKLAEVFGVSRTIIRQVLVRLAHEMIVTLIPNRGAFVTSPTVEEAKEVFELRRLIEPALARRLAAAGTAEQCAGLRAIIEREAVARDANDRHAIIRLSGEFHIRMAEMAGGSVMVKTMRELASLTCLIIILYDAPGVRACPPNEHLELIEAIEAHDGDLVAERMVRHLHHVEESLNLSTGFVEEEDLDRIFA